MPKSGTKAAGNEAEVQVAEAEVDTRSKRQKWRDGTTVTLTEKGDKNPKKEGTMSYDRYEVLFTFRKRMNDGNPPTVSELFKAGYRMDDVRHDVAHGFIEINQPFEL